MFENYVTSVIQNKNAIMFITALLFMSGILAYFNSSAIATSAVVTIVLIVLGLKRYVSYKYILLFSFVFYFGFFNACLRIKDSDALTPLAPAEGVLTGRIISIPGGNTADKQKFFFQVSQFNDREINAKTLVYLTDESGNFSNLNIGNTYKISGKLRMPFKASNPSQFDYGKYLRNYKTYTVFYAENTDCVKIQEPLSLKWKFMQSLNNVRNSIIQTHSKFLKSPEIEILGGIVFGDDAVAPPDYIKNTFRDSGLLHILAASGMNVAFIYGFWYFILRRFRVPMKVIIISGIGVIILYTLMTGLGPSVVRAALMLIFVLAGKLMDRDSHSISLLAFVAALMLLYNPAFINDVGFQLSFIVTFGLLTTANAVLGYLRSSKVPDWLCAELLVPVVAQIWVTPLQMFYFNTISTYSVLANISIMPFLSVISFAGFVSSVLAIIRPIANWICMISDFILVYFLKILVVISNFFSSLPHSVIQTTHPSVLQVLSYYIIILLITYMFADGVSKKLVVTICCIIFGLVISTVNIPDNKLEVIAFDVQNADAFLIKSPMNKYFIVDTGKSPYNGGTSQAKVIILKYLKDRGIKNIEGLIITHFDNDHSGGAVDLMKNLNIKHVYVNSFENKSLTSKNIYKTIVEKNLDTINIKNTDIIYSENNFYLKLLRPYGKSDNENSIITLLSYNKFQTLFMGDAGVEAYNFVKKNLPEGRIEVLKVGHHGAKGVVDSKMLADIQNSVSLISTGTNFFGHPNKVTLDTLRNTDIYRTDRNNSIKIISNGSAYKLLTFDNIKHKYKFFKLYTAE